MDKLRLDLQDLEVERLDLAAPSLNGGLEAFGMGHASTELGQSCEGVYSQGTGACTQDTGACTENASCVAEECSCDECTG